MTEPNTLDEQILKAIEEQLHWAWQAGGGGGRWATRDYEESVVKSAAKLKALFTEHSKEVDRLAYGRGTVDTLEHIKEWADKTETTYNDMMLDRLAQLKRNKGEDNE